MEKRVYMLNLAMKLLGTPYIWGGSTPSGFDCSGFAIWILQVFDVLQAGDWNAQGLSKLFAAIDLPEPGDLVFYGKSKDEITHVMMYAGEMVPLVGGMVIGASGGDHTCTSPEIAKLRGAKVKLKPVGYRRDVTFYGNISSLRVP